MHAGELAAAWGTRETFVAIFTTNLPMMFPLLKVWLAAFLPSTIGSSNARPYKTSDGGFVTIGGGIFGGASERNRSAPRRASCRLAESTLDNESEEYIITEGDVSLQHVQTTGNRQKDKNVIVVLKQVSVSSEERDSVRGDE
jgi:hypothetical protein